MVSDIIEKIYSNEYADFLIEYNGDLSILYDYRDNGYNIIDFFLAVVHLPVSEMTEDIISRRRYATIPSLFGLTSEESFEASGIFKIRNIPSFNLRGNGVLIGIADTGIDYTNPIFQYADSTTRIASIWDQNIVSEITPADMLYGTEYTREQINEALKNENPLSIVPSMDEIGHGTMVAGISAGNEVPESGFYGVAPDSELVIVKLKPAKQYLKQFFRLPKDAIAYQENDIIFGIQYLFKYAAIMNRPIVICITLDTAQYAHDGRGTTSNWLSYQVTLPGIAALTSVGNEGNARRHYYGLIEDRIGYDTVELNVGSNERQFSMELWGTTPNVFSIDILSPSGEYIPEIRIRLNETREITFIYEPTIIFVDYQLAESQSGDQLILFRFTQASPGIWKFNVYSRGLYPISYNIWLPMNNFITPDTFFIRSNPYTTLLSLACAIIPITITAYNANNDSLYINAGRGYTRLGVVKPDIAAPGVNVLSPTLQHGFSRVTGSSAATAHAAGIAAMLFEWGIVNSNYPNMNTQDMRIFLIRGARRRADIIYPNQDWGYGILDIYNVFDQIRLSI
jgi:subtilisin family serine protease